MVEKTLSGLPQPGPKDVPGRTRLLPRLEASGFQTDISSGPFSDTFHGSHHVYTHPENQNIITVPHPRKDLGKGLVNNLRKLAGLK